MKKEILMVTALASTAFLPGNVVGQFTVTQSVIASGGSDSSGGSGGNTFRVDGTIGQALAGVTSTGPGFSLTGGFWQPVSLAPTAAGVSISGRVLRADRTAVFRATVQVLDAAGVRRSAVTNQFGYFRITDLEPGQSYVIDVRHRVLRFAPVIITPTENISGLELFEIP